MARYGNNRYIGRQKNVYQNIKITSTQQFIKKNYYVKDTEYRMEYKKKDHKCLKKKGNTKCTDLYSWRTETTTRKVMYMDNMGQNYEGDFTF